MLRADPPIPSPGWVNMQLRTPHSSLPRPGGGQSRARPGGSVPARGRLTGAPLTSYPGPASESSAAAASARATWLAVSG
jgi:hypothetical protein